MNIGEIYHFLFQTIPGVGVLVAICLVLSLIVSVIMERRTRKIYTNHERTEDDWFFFDNDDEESE